MAAVAVDRAADERRDQARDQQAEREAAHGEGQRPAGLGRDQRHGQHRRIEDRAPGDDLRDAQHRTPRATDRQSCREGMACGNDVADVMPAHAGHPCHRYCAMRAVAPVNRARSIYAATLVASNAGTFAAKRSSQATSFGCAARQSPAKRRSRWPSKQASAIWPTFGIGSSDGRIGLQRVEAALDLVGLIVDPFLDVMLRRPEAAFVDAPGSAHRSCRRHSACRRSAAKRALGSLRNDLAAAGAMIEVFEDHARIEQRRCRPRAPAPESCRADSAVAAYRRHRWRRPSRCLISSARPSTLAASIDLAAERRGRRGTQDHHDDCLADVEVRLVVSFTGAAASGRDQSR